jgi:hypothetical protein
MALRRIVIHKLYQQQNIVVIVAVHGASPLDAAGSVRRTLGAVDVFSGRQIKKWAPNHRALFHAQLSRRSTRPGANFADTFSSGRSESLGKRAA